MVPKTLTPTHKTTASSGLKKTRWAPFFLAFFLIPFPTFSAERQAGRPFDLGPEIHDNLDRGMRELFNYEFKKATQTFEALQKYKNDHPIVSFALASAHWWRLSIFVLEPDEKESAPFLEAVESAIEAAEVKMDAGDPHGEGHLAMGGSLGLWGRWEATNRNWLSAYFKGKKAMKILRRGIELNPELYDAYMGLGMFDYYVATLPAVVRVLAFLGASGDKQQGIQELQEAAEKSAYAKVPASLFLIDIYANMENKPAEAFRMAEKLRMEYPRSPIINLLQCTSLYNNDQIEKLEECSAEFLSKVESGDYSELARTEAFWSRGTYFFKKKEWEKAIDFFDMGITLNKTYDAYFVFCHLFKGYAMDALGQRENALIEYRFVLSQPRRWNSHDNAKLYLKDPFTAEDSQMKKIRL